MVVPSVDLYRYVNLSTLTWEGLCYRRAIARLIEPYLPPGSPKFDEAAAPAVKRERGGVGEGPMVMKNARDLFAQTDQQISALKERITRQREVIKRAKLRGHPTAAAETIQHTLHSHKRRAGGC